MTNIQPNNGQTVRKKPEGWGKRSTATYYKPIYGQQMRASVTQMIKDRQDMMFLYDIWCDAKYGMTPTSLYSRINQSIKFMLDYLDDDKGTLYDWRQKIRITKEHGKGIRIYYLPEFKEGDEGSLTPLHVEPITVVAPRWKTDMQAWLESDIETPFIVNELALSNDEIKEIRNSLASTNILHSITSTSIKLIKA